MDTEKFMNLFESSSEPENDFEAAKKAMRHILEASDHYYYDVSGDGTVYVRAGTRNGAGFATCSITLQQDGLAVVRVTSGTVPAEHQASMRKLCKAWNTHFKLKGLFVENGQLIFESAPFDPVSGTFDADVACDLALCTVHHYASTILALETGTEPWDLIDFYRDNHPARDDDDDGGFALPSIGAARDQLNGRADKRQIQAV